MLKVTTARWRESDRLARLQHTNIVPVYSVHRCDDLQVVCMPYFGRHTLDDLLHERGEGRDELVDATRVNRDAKSAASGLHATESTPSGSESAGSGSADTGRRLPFEQRVVWLMSRIAAGLAHAHERGILHRDLKPANVLVTDDGQPMILDFNLAEDLLARDRSSALIGGTLPYMAPEHLQAVAGTGGSVDVRSDIYAVGVILFQSLTGHLPFASSADASPEALTRAAEQRGRTVPSVRKRNSQISVAVDSIAQRCLAPRPADRYQSARSCRTTWNVNCAICRSATRPIVRFASGDKWLRRHPRITSAGTLSVLATTVILAIGLLLIARGQQVAQLQAEKQFAQRWKWDVSQVCRWDWASAIPNGKLPAWMRPMTHWRRTISTRRIGDHNRTTKSCPTKIVSSWNSRCKNCCI